MRILSSPLDRQDALRIVVLHVVHVLRDRCRDQDGVGRGRDQVHDAGRRVGTTKRRNDRNGWLSQADISVAIHDSAGATIRPVDLAGIVRHEAGHALGLGHSRDPKTKMFPVETVNDITPTDRATLRLLYQLPPGALP